MQLVLGPVKGAGLFADRPLGNSAQHKGESMEQIQALVSWFMVNGPAVAGAILGLLTVAETVVRLTPTQKDDTAVERVGKVIRRFFDLLGLPNRKAGGGEHVAIAEKEDKAA